MSIIATSIRSHQGTSIDTTPNFPLSPIDVEYEGASPTSPVEKPFKCTECPKRFKKSQYRTRHIKEKHQPGSNCWFYPNCDHKWFQSRSYKYEEHLKEHGLEDDHIIEILGRLPSRRRHRNRVEIDSPPHFSPHPIEHDRQSLAEAQQRPLMSPPISKGKDAHHASPPPLMLPVACNPWLRHAEQVITTTNYEDSSGLGPPESLSDEYFALLVRYLDIHIRDQIRFVPASFIFDIYNRLCSRIFLSPQTSNSTQECFISPRCLGW